MKITKEEKSLYKFLSVVMNIFSKTTNRTMIVGRGSELYFYTIGYGGVFEYRNPDELISTYDFKNQFYELKQLPNKNYVLDVYDTSDNAYLDSAEQIIAGITNCMSQGHFALECTKDEEYKLAKIAVDTDKWLRDEDIAYLKPFNELEIFKLDDSLICKTFGLTDSDVQYVTIGILFMDAVIGPLPEEHTQTRMEQVLIQGNEAMGIAENAKVVIDVVDEAPEEFDDEFDPMA